MNRYDQAGPPPATNAPAALRELLRYGKQQTGYAKTLDATRTNAAFRLSISGAPNRANILEAASDFSQWLAIGTNRNNTNGLFFLDNREAANAGHRFYRVRVQ